VKNDCAARATAIVVVKKPELGPTQEALPAVPPVELVESPRGYALLSALETVPANVRRGAAPPRGGAPGAAPALKTPAPAKGSAKAPAKGREPPPAPAPAEEAIPRPKKGDDEDLLQ
jgi:hypothetical protein